MRRIFSLVCKAPICFWALSFVAWHPITLPSDFFFTANGSLVEQALVSLEIE